MKVLISKTSYKITNIQKLSYSNLNKCSDFSPLFNDIKKTKQSLINLWRPEVALRELEGGIFGLKL